MLRWLARILSPWVAKEVSLENASLRERLDAKDLELGLLAALNERMRLAIAADTALLHSILAKFGVPKEVMFPEAR